MACAARLDEAAVAVTTAPKPILRDDEHERLVQQFHQTTRNIQSSERELSRSTCTSRGHVYRLKLLRQGLHDMRKQLRSTQNRLVSLKIDPWDKQLWGHILVNMY